MHGYEYLRGYIITWGLKHRITTDWGVAKVVMASNRQAANKQTLNNWFDALTEFYKKMWATQY